MATTTANLDGTTTEYFDVECSEAVLMALLGEIFEVNWRHRNLDRGGRAGSWGLRMWNGHGEQMLTVFFPNPWIDPASQRYGAVPDWSRLDLWMTLREHFAGVPAEPPPERAEPPVTH